MANIFTADPHFGHANILRLSRRPFASIGEMNEVLLSNLLRDVRRTDDLWLIGDFAYGGAQDDPAFLRAIFDRIPGRKHLVRGNHDRKARAVLELGWESQHDIVEFRDDGTKLVLCHYPMVTWNGARGNSLQLFGHVHQNWAGSRKSVNVGVDCWDFRPVRLPAIRARAETLPQNPVWHIVEPGLEDEDARHEDGMPTP
ncbi:metallophosphoesterase [Cereibacter sphaeroides]|uniref:metallophosphoesterase n=1 Tax=Cereibacter sphaeroides TaxID=1063 RepID=UPI001F423F68|nr:metallophosphoesterase [Cereibacter sphaeroides]MCE6958272.1 metallophosphoesterase [Cereibacter sphaeroides]MCE6971335.1 metallophosphoesterase [Cereibacter sphaeroides]